LPQVPPDAEDRDVDADDWELEEAGHMQLSRMHLSSAHSGSTFGHRRVPPGLPGTQHPCTQRAVPDATSRHAPWGPMSSKTREQWKSLVHVTESAMPTGPAYWQLHCSGG